MEKLFQNSLHAHYLLNSLINTIDNKLFWEIYYHELRQIDRKDEIQKKQHPTDPEVVDFSEFIAPDDDEEKQPKAEELDQYKIIDFLIFEQQIYPIIDDTINKNSYLEFLSKLKEI